jgi:periplasmic protein TonB
MNGTARIFSPYLDEPWKRLAWVAPLSVLVWAMALFGFSLLLKQTAAPPPELKPLEARIIELPTVGGLQGGPAAAHPVAPAKPTPQVQPKRKAVPIDHPRKPRVIPRVIPEVPPSPFGTKKSTENPAAPPPKAASGGNEGAGVPGGKNSGTGSGMGSDSVGARAIYAPVPKIPDDLREDALEALAVAHFYVSYEGKAEVSLVTPTSNPRLNQILLDTLKQWRFFPAMKNGSAIDAQFDVRIPITVQ